MKRAKRIVWVCSVSSGRSSKLARFAHSPEDLSDVYPPLRGNLNVWVPEAATDHEGVGLRPIADRIRANLNRVLHPVDWRIDVHTLNIVLTAPSEEGAKRFEWVSSVVDEANTLCL